MSAEGMKLPSGRITTRGRLFRNPMPQEALSLESSTYVFGRSDLEGARP